MLIGTTIPNTGALARGTAAVEVALHAEQVGFDSAWTVDHLILPETSTETYPYTRQPGVTLTPSWPFLDPLVTLGAAASVTKKLLLGTGVYLLPLRHPVAVAKQAASVDLLSGGRLRFGVGLGWVREEYRVMGIAWEQRGRIFDEQIDTLRRLWRDDRPALPGRYASDVVFGFEPKPLQGDIPLLIGGMNPAARQRAAARGDGWHIIDVEAGEVAGHIADLRADCQAAGRVPTAVPVSMYASLTITDRDVAPADRAFPLMGSLAQVKDTMQAYRAAGLDHLVLAPRALSDVAEYRRQLDAVANHLLPGLRS